MKKITMFMFLYTILISCCNPKVDKILNNSETLSTTISKELMQWLKYEQDSVKWASNYLPLDTSSKPIAKKSFLDSLTTGHYLPLKIEYKKNTLCYKLHYLNNFSDKDVVSAITNKAKIEYAYYKMEGKPLPKFYFIDLDKNIYTKETIVGKTLILNCWFTHCKPCVAEIPKLNKIINVFKNRKDMLFIGLALDNPTVLKIFI